MEIKEIIEILQCAKAEVEWNYPLDYAMAIDKAIDELEKQVARKPTRFAFDYLVCPNCFYRGIYDSDWNRLNYCNRCGQKIDWSDEK